MSKKRYGFITSCNYVVKFMSKYGWRRCFSKANHDVRFIWHHSRFVSASDIKNENVIAKYIPNRRFLGNKYLLYKKLKAIFADKHLEFLPETYNLSVPEEKNTFLSVFKEGDIWITKRASGFQGRGMHLVRKISDLPKSVDSGSLVQKYIRNPLLLNNKKFDLRVFMLVANTKPCFVFYRFGYVKLCIDDYDENSNSQLIHLTNHTVQKRHHLYKIKREETAWNQDGLNDYLNTWHASTGKIEYNWIKNSFIDSVKNIMMKCIHSSKTEMVTTIGKFELYGLDLMIDEDFKVWLIEINFEPALSAPCRVHKPLMPSVIKETIDIVLDIQNNLVNKRTIFPIIKTSHFKLLYQPSAESQTEFFESRPPSRKISSSIFSQSEETKSLSPENKKSKKSDSLNILIEELELRNPSSLSKYKSETHNAKNSLQTPQIKSNSQIKNDNLLKSLDKSFIRTKKPAKRERSPSLTIIGEKILPTPFKPKDKVNKKELNSIHKHSHSAKVIKEKSSKHQKKKLKKYDSYSAISPKQSRKKYVRGNKQKIEIDKKVRRLLENLQVYVK